MKIETMECRHGTFAFYRDDEYVGHSLLLYGDYSEDEVSMFKKLLHKNDVAIEIGSNIGALTIPLARCCRHLYAFEPQPDNYKLLVRNVETNVGTTRVTLRTCAMGSKAGVTRIPALDDLPHRNYGGVEVGTGRFVRGVKTLDGYFLNKGDKIKFIKIDAEGSELEILKGGEKLITRDRPFLYVENDRKDQSAELVGWLIDHKYRCYWHRIPLYYDGNYRGQRMNVFGLTISQMMICFPEELNAQVGGLDEVDDQRVDDKMYHREKARALRRLEKNPDDFDNRALAAHYANLMGSPNEARVLLQHNLTRNPEHKPSLAIKALLDLQDGNWKDGWQGYELRYNQLNPAGFGWRPHDVMHWDGTPTMERVLIWCEQGFGDSIMFARFMDTVLERAPNAILEIQPQLYELFETSSIVPQGQLFRLGRKMPPYKFHCSLPSLPALFHLNHEEQLYHEPYLRADEAMVESWKKRNTPRIGICLRGGVASERSYSRDMPDEFGQQLARKFGPFMTLTHEGQWESYADTAAAIAALDLVLSVDTSVAHLAGAMGVQTILMLSTDPDFRWGRTSEKCPWYKNMRIVRQRDFMDWSSVIDDLSSMLSSATGKAA